MKESPIQLTPDQYKEMIQKKQKEFMGYIQKAEAVTGMGVRAYLEYTPLGIVPKLTVAPLERPAPEPKEEEKPKEDGK